MFPCYCVLIFLMFFLEFIPKLKFVIGSKYLFLLLLVPIVSYITMVTVYLNYCT